MILVFDLIAPNFPVAKSGRCLSILEKLIGSFARPKVLDPAAPRSIGSGALRFEGLPGWKMDPSSSPSSSSEEISINLRFEASAATTGRGGGSLESLFELILKGRGLVEDEVRGLRWTTTEGLELEGGETMPVRAIACSLSSSASNFFFSYYHKTYQWLAGEGGEEWGRTLFCQLTRDLIILSRSFLAAAASSRASV